MRFILNTYKPLIRLPYTHNHDIRMNVLNGLDIGIPLNIFVFSVLAVLQILSFIFLFKNKS